MGPDSPRWLVVFALPDEARPFLAAWSRATGGRSVRSDPPGLPRGMARWTCGDGEAWLCGMGPRNAARWAGIALATRRPARLVTAGYAGGLDPALGPGTVVCDADAGFPAVEGASPARFHCADRIAATAADKAALRARTGADAVEMESGVLREACRARGIPSATVRVISDAAGEDLPLDFGTVTTADDRLHPGKLLWRIACTPSLVPGLVRLGRTTRAAGRSLAVVLARHVARA